MNTRLVNTAADVINAALTQNRTAAGIALALESVQMLMSPETAAELERLRAKVAELEDAAYGDATVRLLHPVEQIRLLHSSLATQRSRADSLDSLLREKQDEPTTVYRAEHPDSGITLGHYGAEAAARAHCEATERRSWPTGTSLTFVWIRDALPKDEENGVAELVVTAGQNEESTTGYIVTALELAAEYDEEADE
ncbi:hypothetical protein [Streptomyces antibioticus]|uniref:hypothetical protein n=1 Tax=Streptomyces antibioticus TaxID=1890 RepID=UPI0033A062A6